MPFFDCYEKKPFVQKRTVLTSVRHAHAPVSSDTTELSFFCNDFDNPMYSSIFAITSADMSGNSAQCLSLQPRQRSKTSEQKVREKNMRIIENSKNLNFVKFSLEQLHKAPKGQDGLKIKLIVYFFEN